MSNLKKALPGIMVLILGYLAMSIISSITGSQAGISGALPYFIGIITLCLSTYFLSRMDFSSGLIAGLVISGLLFLIASSYLLHEAMINLWIMASAIWMAYIVSLLIREVNILFPIALVAALADIWSVYYGPTAKMLQNEALVDKMIVTYPGPAGGPHLPLFGLGDVLFFFLFVLVMRKLKLFNPFRYILLSLSLVVAGIIAFAYRQSVPGIPFMSAALLSTLSGELKLSHDERRYLAYLFGLICFLIAIGISFTFLGR
ncbi:MAG: hypothetical protein PHX89_00330 [bacterium]|nr:hypothetical protein [bacterium]MDD3805671.1 hypothetical protein [bacterium]MDD4557371.1 hypothetical protein [bacterium]